MSDDEGVTPFQVAGQAARRQVTPVPLAKRLSDLVDTLVEKDTSGIGPSGSTNIRSNTTVSN